MFGVKFVTENSRGFFKFESIRRDFILLSINFEDKNACSYVYVVPKRHTTLSKISRFDMDRQKQKFQKHGRLKKAHQISF